MYRVYSTVLALYTVYILATKKQFWQHKNNGMFCRMQARQRGHVVNSINEVNEVSEGGKINEFNGSSWRGFQAWSARSTRSKRSPKTAMSAKTTSPTELVRSARSARLAACRLQMRRLTMPVETNIALDADSLEAPSPTQHRSVGTSSERSMVRLQQRGEQLLVASLAHKTRQCAGLSNTVQPRGHRAHAKLYARQTHHGATRTPLHHACHGGDCRDCQTEYLATVKRGSKIHGSGTHTAVTVAWKVQFVTWKSRAPPRRCVAGVCKARKE